MADILALDQEHHMAGDVLCMTADPLQCAQSHDRFYHVPASNTAVGHLILENRA